MNKQKFSSPTHGPNSAEKKRGQLQLNPIQFAF